MLIVSNWKAYVEGIREGKKLLAIAKRFAAKTRKLSIVLAPPAPLLAVLAASNRSRVSFGGQDVSMTTKGAATGEISAALLRAVGASYAIIGHSERRALGEQDSVIVEKVRRAIAAGLTPIVCMGERERDMDARYLSFLRNQLASLFSELSPKERTKIIVAYEPVWAIGKQAIDAISPDDLAEMILYIRKIISTFIPPKEALRAKILYGGSVEPSNAKLLKEAARIDGFLVGHASAEPAAYAALLRELC